MIEVRSVPEGYTTVTPFFNIKGAAQAIDFYKQAFGAEEKMRLALPDGHIAMSELKIGGSLVRVSDAVREAPTQSSTMLYVDNVDIWWQRAVNAGCEVVLPLEDRFFGDRFGIVKDRFGNRWSLATHIKDVSEAEIKKHAAEAAKVH
jgi:PhnB protein